MPFFCRIPQTEKHPEALKPVLVQKFIPTTGKNLSGERFFPRPFSKDFQLCFFCKGYPHTNKNSFVFSFKGVPLAEKTELKVLGREFEVTPRSAGRCPKGRGARRRQREPFFKRVSLNNTCKASIWVSTIYPPIQVYYIYIITNPCRCI